MFETAWNADCACREAVLAVVSGCDMNASCTGPPAIALIQDTNRLGGGANTEAPSTTGNFCALHFACQVQSSICACKGSHHCPAVHNMTAQSA